MIVSKYMYVYVFHIKAVLRSGIYWLEDIPYKIVIEII